ncbi:CsgG/HfaB family protein [Pontibacter sp. G13]|uniref:CsgG/HfaB family protein n=1 Tax=Pontibacter sp. G13 TaxID=3074898 RepID=UPI00288B2DE9|nr:CsgG/HfaB family protein [Pontibacter sp. G13]WNJ20511.1 CsgG/HfaB family protein [Pontibacter sp. G13]
MRIAIFTLLVLSTTSIFAQKAYTIKSYSMPMTEKPNYYIKAAKDFVENDQLNEAVIYAAYALEIAEKKKDIKNAQDYLRRFYERTTDINLETIAASEAASQTFENDASAAHKATIVNAYIALDKYSKILKRTDPEKFKPTKKKDPALEFEINRYNTQITEAKATLKEFEQQAAEWHYNQGAELVGSADIASNKKAAKHFRYSYEYVPSFKDAEAQYADARKKGTTRLGVTNFEWSGYEHGNAGASLSNKVIENLVNNASKYEFFEAINREQLDRILDEQQLSVSGLMDESTTVELGNISGVNVILVGQISSCGVDRQRLDARRERFEKSVVVRKEKYINEKGKEKTRNIYGTVYATGVINEKTSSATLTANFMVIDVKTGAVVLAGEVSGQQSWNYTWLSSASGDERAVPSSYKKKEVQFPMEESLLNDALSQAALEVYNKLAPFATEASL